jgi:hypothetical protein
MDIAVNSNQNLHLLLNNCIADKHTNQVKNCFFTSIKYKISWCSPCSLDTNLVILGWEVSDLECQNAFLDTHIEGDGN